MATERLKRCPVIPFAGILALYIVLSIIAVPECSGHMPLQKRLFYSAECRGDYAAHFDAYLIRVNSICKECSEMYPSMKEFIARNCSSDCFRNRVFQDCLSATMQLHQMEEIHNMIGELSGKK